MGSDEPPRAASASGPGGSRLARESDVEVERKGPEAELAAMKEALDAELEALEVILEREIEPVVGEFEGQMKGWPTIHVPISYFAISPAKLEKLLAEKIQFHGAKA